VNLGRLLQEGGEAAQAASHYLLALEVRPRDATAPDARRTPRDTSDAPPARSRPHTSATAPDARRTARDTSDAPPARSRPHTSATAWFNLGIALEDLKKRSDAIKAYERAISIEPTLADAWFNLSRLYEAAGKRAAALRSLSKYRLLARHRAT
jgi:tetratricopeptide (TPR) repeat protein